MHPAHEKPVILAIESSCDETSAAVISGGEILSNITASQKIHEQYGGVVPELASRAHQQHIVPVVAQALKASGIEKSSLHAVAFTQGPGLLGPLLVGCSFAKGMAQALGIPLIGVNHMQAHILAHFIEAPRPDFPFVCLTVSGGHTQIVLVKSPTDMELLGETQDDAVGEAFDKAAKILGLPYPGGPHIDRLAQTGNPDRFRFPLSKAPGYHFSFSGVKTSFLYFLRDQVKQHPGFVEENLADICAGYQKTLIEMLLIKLRAAVKDSGANHVGIAGGVSANSALRTAFAAEATQHGWQAYIPAFEYCTDNAAMIAMAAHFKYLAGSFENLEAVPSARMKVTAF